MSCLLGERLGLSSQPTVAQSVTTRALVRIVLASVFVGAACVQMSGRSGDLIERSRLCEGRALDKAVRAADFCCLASVEIA